MWITRDKKQHDDDLNDMHLFKYKPTKNKRGNWEEDRGCILGFDSCYQEDFLGFYLEPGTAKPVIITVQKCWEKSDG